MSFDRHSFFSQRIYIDEEGYPMVDGIRVDDAESLRDIFGNLRRMKPGENRSALVTTWGKAEATVEAFSSPFVIQSVERHSPTRYRASIFAGVSFDFAPSDLSVDEWERLHLYLGEHQIESTFSRKAQAEFLSMVDERITFAAFRLPQQAVSNPAMWDKVYDDREDAWDLGALSPSFEGLAQKWLLSDKISRDVLVPGAGRGFEAEWLSQKGHRVVAEDFAQAAKEKFALTHEGSRVDYRIDDFFAAKSGESTFDAIAELIFFCAIDPARRREYFSRVWERLRPGGFLVGIFLVTYSSGGPPFSTTPWELKSYTSDKFHLRHWQMSQNSVAARLGKEFEVVLQKPF